MRVEHSGRNKHCIPDCDSSAGPDENHSSNVEEMSFDQRPADRLTQLDDEASVRRVSGILFHHQELRGDERREDPEETVDQTLNFNFLIFFPLFLNLFN